jgi:probable rRNA maturation factor
MGIHVDSELSITLVDEKEMSDLHMRWMDETGPTDVLSFPMDEMKPHSAAQGPGMVGDIVLCPDYASEQAAKVGHSLGEELELLTVHGILHLLGYDHREEIEKEAMFGLQEELLRKWRDSR